MFRVKFPVGLAGSLALGFASAQSYPVKTIKIIVPYGTGGAPDILARSVGEKISELSGQVVVIENRPGAAALLGTTQVSKAPNDGYTILIGDTGPLCVAPNLKKKLGYDPERDFVPISNGVTSPLFLAVNAGLKVNSFRDLVALAKADPNLSYGSTGVGSVHHLGMELLLSMAGIRMTHIPYTSLNQSVPALLNGDITLLYAGYQALRPHVTAGKLRLLAVATSIRAPFEPGVPTIAESGFPGYENRIDVGFLLPAGASADVVAKLNGWIGVALSNSQLQSRFIGVGMIAMPSTPDAYARKLRSDREKFRRLSESVGITAE